MQIRAEDAISVAVPTIGRTDTLPMTLHSILSQDYKVDEVVVLDESYVGVCSTPAVNMMFDLLSLEGIVVKIIRRRLREGIAAARMLLAKEASSPFVFMVDDDVVLRPDCLSELVCEWAHHEEYNWAVPYCFLVSGTPKLDGYIDREVSISNPKVQEWIKKYEWFMPYFNYREDVNRKIKVAGTQAILWHRETLLEKGAGVEKLKDLPREDTYLTTVTGPGIFVSAARCDHFEHKSQDTRGEWDKRMFYKVHEVIQKYPKEFLHVVGVLNGK